MLHEHLTTVEGKGLKMTPSWYSFLPADFLEHHLSVASILATLTDSNIKINFPYLTRISIWFSFFIGLQVRICKVYKYTLHYQIFGSWWWCDIYSYISSLEWYHDRGRLQTVLMHFDDDFIWYYPPHSNIGMHILHHVLWTFPKMLKRRICPTIKGFFSWWSFPVFLWPTLMRFRCDIVRRNEMLVTVRDQRVKIHIMFWSSPWENAEFLCSLPSCVW